MSSRDLKVHPMAESHRPWQAAEDRYEDTTYRRVGDSGLLLPPVSLGLWWNFGGNRTFDDQQAVLRKAFDLGVTHFDLANNYGPPPGSAEENFGRVLRGDFKPYRDELIISSKAGWDMWAGPYGTGSSRKYILASADASLQRLGLDYVDIFYSHRFDEGVPVAETIAALDTLVRQGKALYVGISSYSPERTREAVEIARELHTPLVIHQPSYNMLNRWVEDELLETLRQTGLGGIAFTPLAQGLLTGKYLNGGEAKRHGGRDMEGKATEENIAKARALAKIADERGQSLAQMAIAWLLRDPVIASVLIGASSPEQVEENVAGAKNIEFSDEERRRIDEITNGKNPELNQWSISSDA